MPLRFTFEVHGEIAANPNGSPATLYELTQQTLPGTSTPTTQLTQLAETDVANYQITFAVPLSNRYMLRLKSGSTVIFRSDKLADEDYDIDEQQTTLGVVDIRLVGSGAIRLTLSELQANLPTLPLLQTIKNANPVKAVRIDTMQLKQVGTAFEITGAGNLLSFYDENTGVTTEYSDFTYLYRFTLELFAGLPLYNRIINVESQEAVITAQNTGIGANIKNIIINHVLTANNSKIVTSIEQTIQARLDTSIQLEAGGLTPRTVTLTALEIVQGKNYVIQTEGLGWVAAKPGKSARLGCRPRTAQVLTLAALPIRALRQMRGGNT